MGELDLAFMTFFSFENNVITLNKRRKFKTTQHTKEQGAVNLVTSTLKILVNDIPIAR